MGLPDARFDQINGPGASERLALERAKREQEAREQVPIKGTRLGEVAVRYGGGLYAPASAVHSARNEKDAGQFHIPHTEDEEKVA